MWGVPSSRPAELGTEATGYPGLYLDPAWGRTGEPPLQRAPGGWAVPEPAPALQPVAVAREFADSSLPGGRRRKRMSWIPRLWVGFQTTNNTKRALILLPTLAFTILF